MHCSFINLGFEFNATYSDIQNGLNVVGIDRFVNANDLMWRKMAYGAECIGFVVDINDSNFRIKN